MHLVLHLCFFLTLGLGLSTFASAANFEKQPSSIRIRMDKDLSVFPQVHSAHVKKLANRIWLLSSDSELLWRGKKLPPRTFVLQREDKKFDLISSVEFNEYLAGVVAHEVPTSWPREALRAQAIVARSYAWARMQERHREWYHLESDHEDQVFRVTRHEHIHAAVRDTDGIVLRRKNGMVLKAFYHADCGGQTVSAKRIWGDDAYDAGTAMDPWCANRKSNQWNYELDRTDFFRQVGTVEAAGYQVSRFRDRAQELLIGQKTLTVQKLRELLGYFKVRSAVERIEVTPKRVRLSGRGFGHGAGLCQWGTLDQAKAGRSYQQILKHYYPLAKLTGKNPYEPRVLAGYSPAKEPVSVSQSE